jgi:hypothetical protein
MGNTVPVVLQNTGEVLIIDKCGDRNYLIVLDKSRGVVTGERTGELHAYDQGGCCGVGRKAFPERGSDEKTIRLDEIVGVGTHLICERSYDNTRQVRGPHGGGGHDSSPGRSSKTFCYDTKIFYGKKGDFLSVTNTSVKASTMEEPGAPPPHHAELREAIKAFLRLPRMQPPSNLYMLTYHDHLFKMKEHGLDSMRGHPPVDPNLPQAPWYN